MITQQGWQEAKSRALCTLHDQPRDAQRWPTAWRRQRTIAEGLLDEKQRRALAQVRAKRFAEQLKNTVR